MAGHRQVISLISKGSQNISIYNFIIATLDCQGVSQGGGISSKAFALPWGAAIESDTYMGVRKQEYLREQRFKLLGCWHWN